MDAEQLVRDTIARLMKDHCRPDLVDRAEAGQWPAALWAHLTETGLAAAGLPAAAGGAGGELRDSLLVLREASRFAAPVPLAEHFIAGLLLSEQGATPGPGPLTLAGGDFRLTPALLLRGSAEAVAFARWCGQVVLVAHSDTGLKLCRLDLGRAELVHGGNLAGEPRDGLTVDARLTDADVFPVDDDTPARLRYLGAATRCMMMAGALESVLEASVQYARERSQFGRPIAGFQAIQQQLATLAGEVAASSMAGHAICASIGRFDKLDIAIGKARIGEAVAVCTDIAHQVHGAMGYTRAHPLNHLTRRLWCWRDEYGNEREWRQVVGRAFAAGGADNLWDGVTRCR